MAFTANMPLMLVTLAIAATGLLLIVVLFVKIGQVNDQLKLKQHRSKQEGLSDLLNYAAVVDDGVILNKNGSLMASWVYRCEDNASSTREQKDGLAARLNSVISSLDSGWMIHVDAVRTEAPGYPEGALSFFPDRVSAAVDMERRYMFEELGTLYTGYFVLTLTYFPPLLMEKKFTDMMFDDDLAEDGNADQTRSHIGYFKQCCKSFEAQLGSVLEMKRLAGEVAKDEQGNVITYDRLLQWLHYCVTGLAHPIRLPDTPMYIDALIGCQELWSGIIPKIGENYIQVVAVDGMPLESDAGMLNLISEIPVNCRWSSRYILMDRNEAVAKLENFRKKWRQKVRGIFDQIFNTNSGAINQDAVNMVQDAADAIEDIETGLVAAGYYTGTIILMDPDRRTLEVNSRSLAAKIGELGFSARVETINTMEAYLGSLPGHGYENIRRPVINSLNLAHFLPTSSIWTGDEFNPCPMYPAMSPALMHCVTDGASPFRLNLHVGDLGHTLMFGPTGSGKSTHLAMLALQMRRYRDMKIYVFDFRMAMYPAAMAVGGDHYVIGAAEDSLTFSPMHYIATKEERTWIANWLDDILALNGVHTTPKQRNEIARAIANMHESGSYTLSEFSVTVQDEEIREALKPYTIDGQMGYLLDSEEDALALSDFTVFETEALMELGDKYALPILLYLFNRIEKSLDGSPTAIILDEAWLMLGHDVFREKIREWLKVLRKANCMVILATQSLSDAVRSGILDVLVESTATKIFLPNIYANEENTRVLYKNMGLNSAQVDIIAGSLPKREYYYVSDLGRRKYDLALGPLALSFVGATDKESLATIRELVHRYGREGWVEPWLNERGLSLEEYEM